MARAVRLRAYLRGNSSERRDGYQRSIVGNQRGELCVAQALPSDVEIIRLGHSWTAIGTSGSAVTFFPPIDGTNLGMKLWNVGPDSGPSIVIDAVSVREVTNPTTPVATVMSVSVASRAYLRDIGAGSNTPIGGPSLATIGSLSGRAKYGGVAAVAGNSANNGHLGSTNWHLVGSIVSANTNIVNLQKYVPLYGRYIIPPGGLFGVCAHYALGTETGSTVVTQIWWHEVQIPNEAGMGRARY